MSENNSKDKELSMSEKYTSAITLSDMEIFVFPELMYSLVLANIMSPIIWQWRQLDCFEKLRGKSSYKKLMRLKQFIIDEYEFNLDLETWGLTSREKELKRFEKYISAEQIATSNALFGYHGDKYYFDVDIRKHFGLDKYDSDIIPYWKTETIEAMDAFRYKEGYTKRAGECVSLSALYAAAAFIVCSIPLKDIYMLLTPLHSQNFIDIQGGVLTNNRRLVTRTMWFNGTALSNKAQRALRNENVTIVAHNSGYVHYMYDDATIQKEAYRYFASRLGDYLSTNVTLLIIANFLRFNRKYQSSFQFCREHRQEKKYIKVEVLFRYEHGSSLRIADDTFGRLLAEVSHEDYLPYKLDGRICCEQLMNFIDNEKVDVRQSSGREKLIEYLKPYIPDTVEFVEKLADFVHTEAKLPSSEKNYLPSSPIEIGIEQSREEIIECLQQQRHNNGTAELAFYAFRDMANCDWRPFIKAALERNPVSIQKAGEMPAADVYKQLEKIQNTSIYDGKRLAQPDEVANYARGDGIEKAFLLANIIRQKQPEQDIKITVYDNEVVLTSTSEYRFTSTKGFEKQVFIPAKGAIRTGD